MYTKVNSFDSINSVPDIRGLNRRVAKKDKEIAIQARISGLVMKCMSSVGSKVDDGTVSWNVIIRDIFGVDGSSPFRTSREAAPLGILGIGLNAEAYYTTISALWLVSAAMHLTTIAWTVAVMGEDIKNLMAAKGQELGRQTKSFCFLHYPRIAFTGVSFITLLIFLGRH
jgi:hypothetical protein